MHLRPDKGARYEMSPGDGLGTASRLTKIGIGRQRAVHRVVLAGTPAQGRAKRSDEPWISRAAERPDQAHDRDRVRRPGARLVLYALMTGWRARCRGDQEAAVGTIIEEIKARRRPQPPPKKIVEAPKVQAPVETYVPPPDIRRGADDRSDHQRP